MPCIPRVWGCGAFHWLVHYCFIFNSYFAPSHKFREKKKQNASKAHRLAHGSLCEAEAVEMEIYSKFKINNKILFQNYMKQE